MTAARAIGCIALALVSAGCRQGTVAPPVDPPTVHVAVVVTGSLSEWLRFSGRVVPPADRDATLAPRVEGVLAEVSARLGERVSRGRILARVDTAALADGLTAAEAAERSAVADSDAKRRAAVRTRTLVERGVVSGEQAETDEAAASAADAALAQAHSARAASVRRRGWAELAAPFDGIVVRVLRHAGEPVDGTPATPVVELAAEHPVEVALDAPAAALARMSEGQSAEIVVVTGAAPIAANVVGVAGAVDAATGTGPVRLDPTREDAELLLGRIVEARVAVARHDGVLWVPEAALRGGAGGAVEAVVVSDHRSHIRTVVPGIRDGDRVEILSGLAAGDAVVVDDPVGLAEDSPVRDGS